MLSINCNGQLIDLSTPRVMGIINLTPDSFYDGGKLADLSSVLKQAEAMLTDGATFLDVGGYSTRPGASDISETEELARVIPGVEAIGREFPQAIISVDTFRSKVARVAVQAGAAMINDISGGSLDSEMIKTAASLSVPYICMHMRGNPQTMSTQTRYTDITRELITYFSEKIALAKAAGLNDLIVDPGFGFAKDREGNFRLIGELDYLKILERPILVGISRKSMIYKTLGVTPKEALNGTTALHAVALMKGANILRGHDVKEAAQCIRLIEMVRGRVDH